jgi:FkbM family methyltransferase
MYRLKRADMVSSQFLRAFWNAFRSPGFRLFGPRFALDYLRFSARCMRAWGHTGPGAMKMLSARIEYPNQSHALFLLHEVFVQATYRFRPRSAAPVIVDCGANIGFSVLFFKALFPDARIIALEAEPGTCAWLRRNVEANGLQGVEVRHAAAAVRDGTVTLFTPRDDPGSMVSSIWSDWADGEPVAVPAVRLSSLIREPVDFLKLDIEGAEYALVREMVESGAMERVQEAVIEFHVLLGIPDGPAELTALLARAGMHVSVYPHPAEHAGVLRAWRPAAAAVR